jgi:hypothetical protein
MVNQRRDPAVDAAVGYVVDVAAGDAAGYVVDVAAGDAAGDAVGEIVGGVDSWKAFYQILGQTRFERFQTGRETAHDERPHDGDETSRRLEYESKDERVFVLACSVFSRNRILDGVWGRSKFRRHYSIWKIGPWLVAGSIHLFACRGDVSGRVCDRPS